MEVETRLTFQAVSLGRKWQIRARNPSWGNPKGAQLYHRLSPRILLGQEIQREAAAPFGPAQECRPCGDSEDGRGSDSDTGVFPITIIIIIIITIIIIIIMCLCQGHRPEEKLNKPVLTFSGWSAPERIQPAVSWVHREPGRSTRWSSHGEGANGDDIFRVA
ncbi:unnamed protein product [Pleuronectes platessa]|uniref:Uncharacterized protein n=1 Tax=Pleuronectes platessa TaxID=8262 RepID=A0A9N7U6P7_PLEPL|nr:unnamed protein product [Pleuronectes platessa]